MTFHLEHGILFCDGNPCAQFVAVNPIYEELVLHFLNGYGPAIDNALRMTKEAIAILESAPPSIKCT